MRFDQDAKDAWSVKLQGLESSLEAGELMQSVQGKLQRPLGEAELFIFLRLFAHSDSKTGLCLQLT